MKAKTKNIHLSRDINPKEYILTFQPDVTKFVFTGEEDIIFEIKKPTKTITLHADELEVTQALFNDSIPGKITYDRKSETVTISFAQQLKTGKGKLHLKFTGILNDKLKGFYRSRYLVDGKEHFMAVTQFEATDARRAFPSIDEPARKAIFQVNLIIPHDLTAISNTIESETKTLGNGFKKVSFVPTPIMSTYLVAMFVGKFEHVEKKSPEGVLVRVFVTPGKKKQSEFALDAGVKILSFFTDYFKEKYPLPVLDMIAIPDFAAGAMENWGAITYRETALLIDPEHSSTANKQRVALVIGHELAHQWFGNLVTMDWWTNLWLNEGFASYIEYLAVDHLFPEWEFWTQFVFLDQARALELDGLESTHPIEVEIEDPNDINEIYDAVSYSKGASIIRMLAEYVGYEDFKIGLQKYLKKHAYANATTLDLWEALEEQSGKPVKKIMNNWTQKPGYPLITVSEKKDTLELSQTRFFSSPLSEKKSNDKTKWIIPINSFTTKDKTPDYFLIEDKTISLPSLGEGEWIKLNSGEKSLVRVQYPQGILDNLEDAIREKKLGKEDRFGIIRDLFVLAETGKGTTAQALKFSTSYKKDTAYIVWLELASEFAKVASLIGEETYYEDFKLFARKMFADIARQIGFESDKNESHAKKLLRSVVLSQSAKYGDLEIIEKGEKLFKQMMAGTLSLDVDLRGVVYVIAARNGDKKVYDQLLELYRKATLDQEKDRLLLALTTFKKEELIKKTLAWSFTSDVRGQDAFKIFSIIGADRKGKYLAWEFVKENWDEIIKRFAGTYLLPRFIAPAENFTKLELAKDIKQFFKNRDAPSANRVIQQVIEKIESNTAWLKRDTKEIEAFLKSSQKD